VSELSLEAVLWGFDGGRNERSQAKRGSVRVGCDLLIPANATVESQSNPTGKSRLILQFYFAFVYNRRSSETSKLKATKNPGIKWKQKHNMYFMVILLNTRIVAYNG